MAIRELRVSGYRSIRQIRLDLKQLNLLTGPNGCGKSNLYNAVSLLGRAATGSFARAIAEEGGMESVLWAGVQKRFGRKPEPRRVKLAIGTGDFDYQLECGLPKGGTPQGGQDLEGLPMPASQFLLDPQVKLEVVSLTRPTGGKVVMLERKGPLASLRNSDNRMAPYPISLNPSESVLSQLQEPHLYPELSALGGEMGRWRFYHHFRTEGESPLRRPQVGVLTPVLSRDGSDLAAALETIIEIGDADALRESVDRAFPGAQMEVRSERTQFRVVMKMPGVLRPLEAAELSDGTLRYLCLMAALLSPRPPELLALNEPETSIHPDLVAPLARLIAGASKRSQMWITTHSRALAEQIEEASGEAPIELRLVDGETRLT